MADSRLQLMDRVGVALDSPGVVSLIRELERLRWTGRVGYGPRALLGVCVVRFIYGLTSWVAAARLVGEHAGLRAILGVAPSKDAVWRFTRKLRHRLDVLADAATVALAALAERLPRLGRVVAIDSTDLPAYANGQRYRYKGGPEREAFSDPDASWGHRSAVSTRKGGGFYGYKLHMAACAITDLPLAWTVESARVADMRKAADVIDRLPRPPDVAVMDAGYWYPAIAQACRDRGVRPVIAPRKTMGRLPDEDKPFYRQRVAVEREFGRLKHVYGLATLKARGLDRVRVHASLCILTRLAAAEAV